MQMPTGPFAQGQVLADTYEITGVLGAGGMGVVYEARDRLLDRAVAVKAPIVQAHAQALRREATAMAAIHHPNLVAIYTRGREGEVDFMVMERVFGMTLEDRIEEACESGRPISLDEVLRVLVSVTDALTAIHRAGVAHRDIKSANVMLSGQRVVLTDFGLVTPEIDAGREMQLAGSVAYMAPELIMGSVEPGRVALADLYALGVVAFEVLAGRRPYGGDSPNAVFMAHLEQAIPDVRALRNDVPDDLAPLIRELLAKEPMDRPESSEAVLWRLNAIRARLQDPGRGIVAPLSVFIVDDDPAIGVLLKRSLQWSLPSLVARVVTDPTKALERMRRRVPDVVVVDLNMPDLNGVELCMSLSALPRRSRPVIVAISTQASYGDLALLRSLGVHDFVHKDEGFVPRLRDVIGRAARDRPSLQRPRRTPPLG